MKKKNTGVEESNQGHRAKMNSSDRFGLEQDDADGWTTVLSKRSKKKLRKEGAVEDCQKKDSRSRRRARRSRADDVSPPRREDADEEQVPSVQEDVDHEEQVPSEQEDNEHGEHVDFEQDSLCEEVKDKKDAPEAPAQKKKRSKKAATMHLRKEEMAALQEVIRRSKPCPLRDVDPSIEAPDMKTIKRVVNMLKADPSLRPEVHLGAPSTKRRERALKRLKLALSIKYLEAEKLLTSSALAHAYGK